MNHSLELNSTSNDPRSLYHNDQQNFCNNSLFKSLTQELTRLKEKVEVLTKERNGLKQQGKAAIHQWEKTLRENNETKDQLIYITQQRDDALKKINHEISQRLKTAKDLARLTEERNSAVHEYNLIMSERDSVHKEMEKLNEELMQNQRQIKSMEQEKKILIDEIENAKKEINNTKLKMMDKELFLKQIYREQYTDYQYSSGFKYGSSTTNKWGSSSSGISSGYLANLRNPISLASTNSNITSLADSRQKHQFMLSNNKSEMLSDNELELKRQIQALEFDYKSIHSDFQKCLMQNDKVEKERESIKILCDKLRRERDRAIRDRAEALQDLNDFKLKIESNAQIRKYLNDSNDLNNLTDNKNKQINNTSSKDSAISADIQDNDYETLHISLVNNFRLRNNFKNPWGFTIKSQDKTIQISGINLESPAEEKLKLNDIILSINSINITDEQLCNELLCKFDRDLKLVIQRKKQLSSILNINLDCCKNEHGIICENAFLIKKLIPDSEAYKNENISVGDRLLSINGNSLENSTIHDVMQLLREEDNLLLKVYKQNLNNQNLSTSIILNNQNYNYKENNQNEKLNFNNKIIGNSIKPAYQKDDLHLTQISNKQQSNYSPNIGHYQSIKRSSKKSKIYLLNDSSGSFQMDNDKISSTLLDKAYNKLFKKSIKSKNEKKEEKLKKNSPEKETLDNFNKILNNLSEDDTKKKLLNELSPNNKSNDKNKNGTWPSCKTNNSNNNSPASPTYGKINPLSNTTYSKKKERKSLAIFANYKQDNNSTNYSQHNNILKNDKLDQQNNKSIINFNTNNKDYHYGIIQQKSTNNKISNSRVNTPVENNSYKSLMHHHLNKQNERSLSSISSYSSTPKDNYSKSNNSKKYIVNHDVNYKSFNVPNSSLSMDDEMKLKKSKEKTFLADYFKPHSYNKQQYLDKMMFEQNQQQQHQFNLENNYFNNNHDQKDNLLQLPRNSSLGFYSITTNKRQLVASNNQSNYGHDLESFYNSSIDQGLTGSNNAVGDSIENNSITNHSYFNTNIDNQINRDKKSSPINTNQFKGLNRLSITSSPSYHTNEMLFSNSPSSHYSSFLTNTQNSLKDNFHYSSNQNSFKNHVYDKSNSNNNNQNNSTYGYINHQTSNNNFLESISSLTSNQVYQPDEFINKNQRFCISSNNNSVASKLSNCSMDSNSLINSNAIINTNSSNYFKNTPINESSLDSFSYSNIQNLRTQIEWSFKNQNSLDKKLINSNKLVNKKQINLSIDKTTLNSEYEQKVLDSEIRTIRIEKSKEKSLGIQIECGKTTNKNPGIFISSVNEGSLADEQGLKVGDQLLEICGINMRSANYEAAASVLRQCGKVVLIKVQYNPDKFYHTNNLDDQLSKETTKNQMINNQESDCELNKERTTSSTNHNNKYLDRETNLDREEIDDKNNDGDDDDDELKKHELEDTLKDFRQMNIIKDNLRKDNLNQIDKDDIYSDKCLYF